MTLSYFSKSLLLLIAWSPLFGQTSTLSGRVTDESGAAVPGVTIRIQRPDKREKVVSGQPNGNYSVSDVTPGDYSVVAEAPHLEMGEPIKITIKPGLNNLDLQLRVANLAQQVTVSETSGPMVSVESTNNASATVLTEAILRPCQTIRKTWPRTCKHWPDRLRARVGRQSLWTDSAAANCLRKSRSEKSGSTPIRSRRNMTSWASDELRYSRNRGSDQFHGNLGYNFATDWWNSRNPYSAQKHRLFARIQKQC